MEIVAAVNKGKSYPGEFSPPQKPLCETFPTRAHGVSPLLADEFTGAIDHEIFPWRLSHILPRGELGRHRAMVAIGGERWRKAVEIPFPGRAGWPAPRFADRIQPPPPPPFFASPHPHRHARLFSVSPLRHRHRPTRCPNPHAGPALSCPAAFPIIRVPHRCSHARERRERTRERDMDRELHNDMWVPPRESLFQLAQNAMFDLNRQEKPPREVIWLGFEKEIIPVFPAEDVIHWQETRSKKDLFRSPSSTQLYNINGWAQNRHPPWGGPVGDGATRRERDRREAQGC